MPSILPQMFNLPVSESKTYYEDLSSGKNATINVLNLSPNPVDLVVTRANADTSTYTISGFNSRSLSVDQLLSVSLSSSEDGPAFGGILITTLDDIV